jgi:hypothetical protein
MESLKMNIKDAANEFEKLVNADLPMEFRESANYTMPEFAHIIIKNVLDIHGIKYEFGDKKVGDFVCLRLSDTKIRYLDVGNEHFMWCDEGHHNSIHPDEVLVYLFKTYSGLDVKVMQDRTAVFEKDGQKIYVPH